MGMFEKNIYIKQAEVKGSLKQNATGTLLINEVTVNSTLKNYKKILHDAIEITLEEIEHYNKLSDNKKEKPAKKTEKTEVKGLQ